MADAKRLFGMKAAVTAAGSGIGEAIARTLMKHGSEVLAVDSVNSGVDSHFKAVRGIRGAPLDLYSNDSPAKLGTLASDELGVVDILVLSFDPPTEAPIGDGDDDALAKFIERKIEFFDKSVSEVLPLMKNTPAGRIVLLGANRSLFSENGSTAHQQSMAALAELTARIGSETAEFGINANYIQPGAIMTPESRLVFRHDKKLRDFCIQQSAARRLGEPVDIAKVALFLATDDSVFVSGTGIVVDGGAASA